jgi:hypothetical protein
MAFLDNSGDIILDAVLTDAGRKALARGDGSMQITYFALCDDSINYELFKRSQTTAYQGLGIFRTPIPEAFSRASAGCKYKLLKGLPENLLYLPVIKLYSGGGFGQYILGTGNKTFIVAVDSTTVQKILGTNNPASNGLPAGVLDGNSPGQQEGRAIVLDQGIDNGLVLTMNPKLRETQFIVTADVRLGAPFASVPGGQGTNVGRAAQWSFTDDDHIATYVFTDQTDSQFVSSSPAFLQSSVLSPDPPYKAVAGAFGARIKFKLKASMDLRSSNELFTKLGNRVSSGANVGGMSSYYYLDSMISVSGQTTGYRIDVPVRYVKAIV